MPEGMIDARFSNPDAEPASWASAEELLATAELYWISTIRSGGRPHVAPLIGLWRDSMFWFCTGATEQKHRNLDHHDDVVVTTGTPSWNTGIDLVVEGRARRVTGAAALAPVAEAYLEKYGEVWRYEAGDEGFGHGDDVAHVFSVAPTKVIAFAKDPHGQTTFRP